MKKLTTILVTGVAALFFTACGGGSSGDDTNPPVEYTYNLQNFLNTVAYSMTLEGTTEVANNTINISAEIFVQYKGTFTTAEGDIVHEKDITQIFNRNGTEVIGTSNAVFYNGYMVYQVINETGVYCVTPLDAEDITPIPTDAKIGYISDSLPLECSDGTYITYLGKLESAGGSNATIKGIINTYSHKGGTLINTSTSETVVDPSMNIINFSLDTKDFTNGVNTTLDSTSITQN